MKIHLAGKVALVTGRLHGEGTHAKGKPVGFGPGHVEPAADMTIDYVAGGARKRLTGFTADAKESGKPNKKVAEARDAAINAVLTSEKDTVKLSPDVEAQARRLGRAIGDKVVAYARAQGWIAAPEPAQAEKLPEPRLEQKPEQKPTPKADKPAT